MKLPIGGIAAVLVHLLLLLFPVFVEAKKPAALVSNEEIPKSGYKSWSMFLVCTPDWVLPGRSNELADLYGRFNAFGSAIGSRNVAVWFWKDTMSLSNTDIAQNVDVPRSSEYCRVLGLRPSGGPYVVITSQYPDIEDFPKDRAILTLGGLTPQKLAQQLNKVTDSLLLSNKVDASVSPSQNSPAEASLWVRLLESSRQAVISVGCAASLKITTGLLDAELKGCKQ